MYHAGHDSLARLLLKLSDGGEPRVLGEGGDEPVIAPSGDRVLFERARKIWSVPIDGSRPAAQLFFGRGNNSEPRFSPDGLRNRADRLSAPETRYERASDRDKAIEIA